MKPLRFCMLTTFYPPYHFGGDAIGLQRFVNGLVRAGHEVTVIHDTDAWRMLVPKGTPEPGPYQHGDGVTVHPLRTKAGKLSCLLTQQLGRPVMNGRTIKRIIDEGDFDVVNFHNVSLIGGPGLLDQGADAVRIYMAHEHWLVCASHVLWRHGKELCDEQQCTRCVLAHRRPPQLWRYTGVLDRKAKQVDAFVAMSRFSAEKHAEFGFSEPMEVLPYFLPDVEQGAPGGGGPSPHDRPYFLFVGRLEQIKGLDDVIPAMRGYPEADLVIAGDGNHAEVLRGLAEGIDNVKFLGRLDPADLDRWYRGALALVVPSVCYETFGIILIESFRYGTPVVARRIGPFPEIVEASGGGELFDTASDLVDALRRMQQDDERRRRMGEAGFDAWKRLWSESAVIPRYLDVVRRAAAERQGTADLNKGARRVLEVLGT